MSPIKTAECNFVYCGPSPEIADLPCVVQESAVFCTWNFTDEERRLIAAGANLRLGIHGMRPIPPVSLQVVDNAGEHERVPSPCVCGREIDDAIHGGGAMCHSFRTASLLRMQEEIPENL